MFHTLIHSAKGKNAAYDMIIAVKWKQSFPGLGEPPDF